MRLWRPRNSVVRPTILRMSSPVALSMADEGRASIRLHQAPPILAQALGQSVTDETQCRTCQNDRQGWHRRHPPGLAHIVLALGDHGAPFRLRRRYAESEEREARQQQDV